MAVVGTVLERMQSKQISVHPGATWAVLVTQKKQCPNDTPEPEPEIAGTDEIADDVVLDDG